MILERLILTNFRSYPHLDLEFGNKANLIVGSNASGKTNLAEAIYFLSLARSWRTQEEKNLIRFGEEYASVRAFVREGDLHREILMEITAEGKKVSVNGKILIAGGGQTGVECAYMLMGEGYDVSIIEML